MSDVTPAQRKEMEDFRATLPTDLQEAFDRMIEAKGEEAIYAILGHLKQQAEYVQSL